MTAATAVHRHGPAASWRRGAAAAAATSVGVAVGALVGADPRIGVAVALVAAVLPLALLDLPVAVAIWAASAPLSNLPLLDSASLALGVLVVGAWVLRVRAAPAAARAAFRLHGPLLALAVAQLGWVTLSLGWADHLSAASDELLLRVVVVVVLIVMATGLRSGRDARIVILGLLAGTVLSVVIGVAGGQPGAAPAGVDAATSIEGRLRGATSDPNFLAAYLVPLVVLATALRGLERGAVRRLMVPAVGVLLAALLATQSRGGLIAFVVVLVAGLVLVPGRRAAILGGALAAACLVLAYVAVNPSALDRVTSAGTGKGSGRGELWLVAGRMTADQPLVGVGLANFPPEAIGYVRRPGALEFVGTEIERPHVVHNTYLQALAETGVIGLLLLVALLAALVRAAWRAVRRFAADGDRALAGLAVAVVVADLGVLAAAVFLSLNADRTVWVLLGLGPVLLSVSRQAPGARWPGR